MRSVRPIRSLRVELGPNSFIICTYAAQRCKSRSFCTYKTTSHLHIPNLLKAAYFQSLPQKTDLTPFRMCRSTNAGVGGIPMIDSKRVAPSGVSDPRFPPVTSYQSLDCPLVFFNHSRLKCTAILN